MISTSQMAARPTSTSMPSSATLLFDPTVTYNLVPSLFAMIFLVQWWLIGPPGKSTTLVAGALIFKSPFAYGNLTTASALAI